VADIRATVVEMVAVLFFKQAVVVVPVDIQEMVAVLVKQAKAVAVVVVTLVA
jgi:hypothetical protein